MNLKYLIGLILCLPLLPLMYLQGIRIRRKVPKLPEAREPEGESVINQDTAKTLRMLAIGESTIAGVGVETHQEGFTGTLANELSSLFQTNVSWKVYARSGYTAKQVDELLVPQISEEEVDLLVVGIGGNDAFNLNMPVLWRKAADRLIKNLKARFPNALIVFCSMPPIKEFPAFTSLIRSTLGNLIEMLGRELGELVKEYDNVYYHKDVITMKNWNQKFGLQGAPSDYFSDGVHPSKLTYQIWGKDIASAIRTQPVTQQALNRLA